MKSNVRIGRISRPVRSLILCALLSLMASFAPAIEPKISSAALDAIFGETVIADNVRAVLKHADTLPLEERFSFLLEYVLPGANHASFRVAGEFVACGAGKFVDSDGNYVTTNEGQLLSPVFALLKAAIEAGQLKSLRERVASIPVAEDELRQKGQAAMLILIDLSLNDSEAVSRTTETLIELMDADEPKGVFEQWPETLVAFHGLHKFANNSDVHELIEVLHATRVDQTRKDVHLWRSQIGTLLAKSKSKANSWTEPTDWIATARPDRSLDAQAATSRWIRNDRNELRHVSGYSVDFVTYRYPLLGDFEVVGDYQTAANLHFVVSGKAVGAAGERRRRTGTFRTGFSSTEAESASNEAGLQTRFRLKFQDDVVSLWLNGKLFQEMRLPADRDPWFSMAGWWTRKFHFRDVQISSTAEIPDAVPMSTESAFESWMPYHGAKWKFDKETSEIRSLGRMELADSIYEGLLRYQRPLQAGDSVEYEFYYASESAVLHPALGRMAFLIAADGVSTHMITTGAYERTHHSPNNAIVEHQYQKGDSPIPLKRNAWNRTKVSVSESTVTITLNGAVIFERPRSSSAPIPFGLFRYVDTEDASVRNVVMRGGWPDKVPSPAKQELSNSFVAELDERLPKFSDSFADDLSRGGISSTLEITKSPGGTVITADEGIVITQPGVAGKWSGSKVSLPFSMKGDFDVEVEFTDAQLDCDKTAAFLLNLYFEDQQVSTARLGRRQTKNSKNTLQSMVSHSNPDRKRKFSTLSDSTCDATSGRLRLARRGSQMYFLFAEGDSGIFRLIDSDNLTDAPTKPSKIELGVTCDSTGSASVMWKNLRLSADELYDHGKSPERKSGMLYVMNADGSGLRRVGSELAEDANQGSPDWSPDGRQIVFDAWTGNSDTKMYLVNADGTRQRVLSTGGMPSFSPAGKRVAVSTVGRGLVTMALDGSDEQMISQTGWGVQWSPDGKWWAFTDRQRGADLAYQRNIVVMNTATGAKRYILTGEDAKRYSIIYWNMEWSPDSKQICFKGQVAGGPYEVAIANLDGSAVDVLTEGNVFTDLAWHPDGSRILFSGQLEAFGYGTLAAAQSLRGRRLFQYDLKTKRISLLPGQPMEFENTGMAWSPDGSQIAFTGRQLPGPVRILGHQ